MEEHALVISLSVFNKKKYYKFVNVSADRKIQINVSLIKYCVNFYKYDYQ